MKLLFFDLETTGFSREHNDIIELAGILVDSETKEKIDEFHEYIKPRQPISRVITDLTGITNSMVQNKLNTWDVLPMFYVWCKEVGVDAFVGHNIDAFDMGFMRAKAQIYNVTNFKEYPTIDTLKIAKKLNKEGKIHTKDNKQPTLGEYFGIEYDAHSAINDVVALKDIYFKMLEL